MFLQTKSISTGSKISTTGSVLSDGVYITVPHSEELPSHGLGEGMVVVMVVVAAILLIVWPEMLILRYLALQYIV
jgi:hypothetical protein